MPNQGVARLPFVQVVNGEKDYWATAEESGRWEEDNRVGREYADGLVSVCQEGQLGMALGYVTQAVVRKGRYGGIEVGFFNRLGEIASFASRAAVADGIRQAA